MWQTLFSTRSDFLYVNYESSLRQCDNDNSTLPGVVVPGKFESVCQKARGGISSRKRAWLVSFAGHLHGGSWGSSIVRMDLCKGYDSCSTSLEGCLRKDVLICCTNVAESQYDASTHEHLLLDSNFCLAPRGDERWSYRFVESLKAGCVPVLLSDGLEFPFAPLINWTVAAVRIDEAKAADFGTGIIGILVEKLPQVAAMRQNVIAIYRRCFQTIHLRVECLLLSLKAKLLEQKTLGRPRSPPVAAAESMFRPVCPQPDRLDPPILDHFPSEVIHWNFTRDRLDRPCLM